MTLSKKVYPYEQATAEFDTAIAKSELHKTPLINWLGEGKVTRHRGSIRNIQGENPLDQTFEPVSATTKVEHDVIRETNIPAYIEAMRQMGTEMARVYSQSMWAGLDEIFDHSSTASSDSEE